MAVYCKKCIKICLGIDETNPNYKYWLVSDGWVCEGCGHKYLEDKKQ